MARRKRIRRTPLESYGSTQQPRARYQLPEAPAHKRKARKSNHPPYGKRN